MSVIDRVPRGHATALVAVGAGVFVLAVIGTADIDGTLRAGAAATDEPPSRSVAYRGAPPHRAPGRPSPECDANQRL